MLTKFNKASPIEEANDKFKEDPEKWARVGKATRSTIYINETAFIAEIDSMGQVSVLHQRVCEQLNIKIVKETSLSIRMFNMTKENRKFGVTEPITLQMNRNIITEQVIIKGFYHKLICKN